MPAAETRGEQAIGDTSRPVPLAVLALVFNALVWGVSWWPFRALDALGVHALWATAMFNLAGLAALSAWRPGALRAALAHPALWPIALGAGLSNAGFNWGVLEGEVMRVVLLFYLMPVWAALMARAWLGEPIDRAALARIALAVGGAAVVLWDPARGWPLPASLADWLGLGAGAAFALANVTVRRQRQHPESVRAAAMFVGGVAIPAVVATGLMAAGRIAPLPAIDGAALAWLALLAIAFPLANLGLQYGAARLSSALTATVMLSEILFAAVSSTLIADEPLGATTLAGGIMIALASLLAARPSRPQATGQPCPPAAPPPPRSHDR